MATSEDLFMAILSMDAYNRGYNAGIGGGISDGSRSPAAPSPQLLFTR